MLRVRVRELADLFQLLQYKYEDHTTSDCPQKDVKVCSNCAETGHTYRECQNCQNAKARTCVNCTRDQGGKKGE